MAEFRKALPQLGPAVFLTDSGLETDLLFNRGVDLPEFAAFPLLTIDEGSRVLRTYYTDHARVAIEAGAGFVLEAPTWRANTDWGRLLGFDAQALDDVNRLAVDLLARVRSEFSDATQPFPISGCLGPRAETFRPDSVMSAETAAAYHRPQVDTFAGTVADLVTAMTLTYPDEAIGIAMAARDADIPVVLSFTVETDGKLPDGSTLSQAIEAVDEATAAYPAYYMINCAHPTHFAAQLDSQAPSLARIKGIRANASTRSHAELDAAADLDAGDPVAFGHEYADLRTRLPNLTVLGGCCGSDIRHVQQIAAACL